MECIFLRNNLKEYPTLVVDAIVIGPSVTEIECEYPQIPDGHINDTLTLSVRITQDTVSD